MAEPTTSAAMQAVAAPALAGSIAGALTGLDYGTLLFGFAGAFLAMRSQEPRGVWWAIVGLFSVTLFALAVTWFVVDLGPSLAHAAGLSGAPALGHGRVIIAWVVGYYAQSAILPAGGRAITNLFGRLGGREASEEGKQ